MSESPIRIEKDKHIATVTLSQPEKMNAMDKSFFTAIKQAFESLDEDSSVRVIVLAAEGKHFSAGLDLKDTANILGGMEGDPARVRARLRHKILWLQSCFSALEACRQPIIAAIHGACVGAGVDLVAAADIRLASDDAWFSIKEVDIGIVADVGTLQRCTHLIPGGILRELALTGRKYTTPEALNHGFVNHSYANKDALIEAAQSLAAEIAAKSPLAVVGTKHIINHARDHTVHDGLDYVASWNAGHLIGEDLMKAATASLTKKTAVFDDLLDDE